LHDAASPQDIPAEVLMSLDAGERAQVEVVITTLQALVGGTAARPEPDRRYNGYLLYFTGVLTFSGALVVGIIGALPAAAAGSEALKAMLGGMLFWLAVVVILGTISAGIIQGWKMHGAAGFTPSRAGWCQFFFIATSFAGGLVAAYAIRGASAMASGASTLPGWYDVFQPFAPV
jgi:hypothetical protein